MKNTDLVKIDADLNTKSIENENKISNITGWFTYYYYYYF